MPIIARFYGVIIKMYFNDHIPPHFHAIYGEYVGMFEIDSLEMIEGDLPNRAKNLVSEWGKRYQNELKQIWETQQFIKLEGLE